MIYVHNISDNKQFNVMMMVSTKVLVLQNSSTCVVGLVFLCVLLVGCVASVACPAGTVDAKSGDSSSEPSIEQEQQYA